MKRSWYNRGFTLVELMIALSLTLLLVSGIAGAYITTKATISQVEAIENAQEVIRGAYELFGGRLKGVSSVTLISGTMIEVSFDNEDGALLSCSNSLQAAAFTERYSLQGDQLICEVDGTAVIFLAGIDALNFSVRADTESGINTLLTVVVSPRGLPENFQQAGMLEPAVRLDFALKSVILTWAT